jgi:threonine/homoserine/homoserine lactone efflux protein
MLSMGTELGELFVGATAVAISPVPIVAAILILFSAHARRNGIFYLLGWLLGLLIVLGIVLLLPGNRDFSRSAALLVTGGALLRITVGLFFLAAAFVIWLRRPKTGQPHPMPAWTEKLTEISGIQALLLAVGLAVINPKNLAVAVSLLLSLLETGAGPRESRLVLLVFVALGSVTVAVPVIYRLAAGKRADQHLQTWKEWLIYHNASVMCVLFILMGMLIFGKGMGGLLQIWQ